MPNPHRRPVFLDLTRIRMPVNALVSILHRIAGMLLFLSIPVLIYLLDLSLRSEQDYEQVISWFDTLPVKLFSVLMVWALAHHLFAGLRFLLIDLRIGIERETFKRNAWVVNLLGVMAALLAGGLILS